MFMTYNGGRKAWSHCALVSPHCANILALRTCYCYYLIGYPESTYKQYPVVQSVLNASCESADTRFNFITGY